MKKRLKILLITEYFPPRIFGGGEISAYLLAKNLAKKGIDVTVLTSKSDNLPEMEKKEGFEIMRKLKTGQNPNNIFSNFKRAAIFRNSVKKQIKKLEKTEHFDAIHFLNTTSIVNVKTKAKKIATINGYTQFCPKGNLFYKEKSECTGCNPIKFVGCIVNSEYVGKNKMNFLLRYNPIFWALLYCSYRKRRKTLKNVDRFIAISNFVKKTLIHHGVTESKISNIYNIADIQDSSLKIDSLKYKIKNKKVISIIGALEKIKGVDSAIRAFSMAKNKNAVLLIVGEGSDREKLEELSENLGIKSSVIFTGSVDQKHIPFIYKSSDLIILNSLWPEPFSRVVMESAFFRKPILASAVGGNKDLPKSNLFTSEKELAGKIDLFLSKKQKPVNFELFNPEKNIRKIVALYLSVNS